MDESFEYIRCLDCEISIDPYSCATACAVADLYGCKAIVDCTGCESRNEIEKIISYRTLKLFVPKGEKNER